MTDIANSILAINSDAQFSVEAEDVKKITWHNKTTPIAEADILAKQKELQTAERYGDQLRATLQKHNLTHLANKKPGMIEKRMQNATNRLWDCLTDITDPEWVRMAAGSESSNCNKNSKNRSSDSAAPKASPAK